MLRSAVNLLRIIRILFILGRHRATFVFDHLIAHHGVRFLLVGLSLSWLFPKNCERPGICLAKAFQKMGPSFVKFGQSLATRADLVGEEIARDLSCLQDRLPPFASKTAISIIERAFDKKIDDLFSSFDPTPIAAASIAQVHRAVTNDGRDVAVKVLRPHIQKRFEADLDFFFWIAECVEALQPNWRRLKPVAVIDIFAQSTRQEMNLLMEAAAASELHDLFQNDADLHVPKIDWERSANDVLTLEFLDGVYINDLPALKAQGFDPKDLLKKSAEIFFKQVFRDGFFHADLHPRNMFVLKDGSLAPIDFGIMGRIDEDTRYYLAMMLLGFLQRDYKKVADIHFDAGYVPCHQSRDLFAQACRSVAEPILDRPLHEISVGQLLGRLFRITEEFEMEAQPQLLLLQKTMLVAEGVGRMLCPEINMWQLAQPLIESWAKENYGIKARIQKKAKELMATTHYLPRFFEDIHAIRQKLEAAPAAPENNPLNLWKKSEKYLWALTFILIAYLILQS